MVAVTDKRLNGRDEETGPHRRYCSWMMAVKFLGFLLPIFIGIVMVRSGRTLVPPGPPSSSPACAKPPLDNCSFYPNCLESRYRCGPSGYPIKYGQHYCEKFSNERSLLNSQGQQWMIDTMQCLQIALVPEAIDINTTTCQTLNDQAFGTHAPCYVDNGLCTLGLHNWVAILEIVDIRTFFQSWDAFKATVEATAECAELFAFLIGKGLF